MLIPPPNNRNCSLDALRILAMLMVVVLHLNLFAGLTKIPMSEYPISRLFSQAERAFCFCAVDVYGMLTGYFCVASKQFKLERYLRLWLLVAFYTIGIYAFFHLWSYFVPTLAREAAVEGRRFFPIPLASGYWYFNAYTVVFFMMPFMNAFLVQQSRFKLQNFLILLLFLVPVLEIFGVETGLSDGYNPSWLCVMYCAGAYLRLHPIDIRRRWIILLLMVLQFILVGLSFLTTSGVSGSSYCMPQYVLMAGGLLILFSRTTIRTQWLCKLITWAAPLAFSVYIIHLHPCIWGRIPRWIALAGEYRMQWWFIPAASLLLFVACLIIDYGRVLLFRLCRAEAGVRHLTRWCIAFYEYTIGKLLAKIE